MRIFQTYTSRPKILGICFLASAVLFFIIGAGIIAHKANKIKKYVQTTGTVVGAVKYRSGKDEILYSRIIRYYDENQKSYDEVEGLASSIKPEIGKKVKVAYDPLNPSNVIILSFYSILFVPLIFFILSTFFCLFGIFYFRGYLKDKARKIALIQKGNVIFADIVEVDIDYNTAVNGRHPYIIYAKTMIGKKEIEFESDPVWFDPKRVFSDGKIPVFLDPMNPQNYYVDVRKGIEMEPKSKHLKVK